MSDHGFKTDPKLIAAKRTIEILTRRLTIFEEFNETEITAFLKDARDTFATQFPGRPVLTRFAMGIYTEDVLRDESLGLTEIEIAERLDRTTIFIVPYLEPNLIEFEKLVSAWMKAEIPMAAMADATTAEAFAEVPESLRFFGPGDVVYDFGGLQP